MKKYKIYIIIILLIVFPLIFFISYNVIKYNIYDYEYMIKIDPFNNTSFVIYTPLPIDIKKNDEPSNVLINNINIKSGIAMYNINKTEKDVALKISSSNQTILNSKGYFWSWNNKPTFLSLEKLDENGRRRVNCESVYWIHSDINASIIINYKIHSRLPGSRVEYNIHGNLSIGWNIINGYHSSVGP